MDGIIVLLGKTSSLAVLLRDLGDECSIVALLFWLVSKFRGRR